MNLSSVFTSPGFITGIISMGGALSVATGHPAFGAFLDNPNTATTVTSVVSGLLSLFAGAMEGIKKDGANKTPPVVASVIPPTTKFVP
jgi:hypothetical protein